MNEKTIVAGVIGVAVLLLGAAWYSNSQRGAATDTTNTATTTQPTDTMPTELNITDTVVGTGAEAKAGDTVFVHYTGTLTNGEIFDSSIPRGEPFSFQLGAGQVIQGWDIGIQGMKVGGKRTLVIPSSLAYGEQGIGPIPPNATLKFDVELLDVQGGK
jgi:FKBP-type peptidyl-prolyl cis-trans isomerase